MEVVGQRHSSAALPPEITLHPLYRRLCGSRVGVDGCGKSRFHRDSIPDLPVHSKSVHRLHYPGPHFGRRENQVPLQEDTLEAIQFHSLSYFYTSHLYLNTSLLCTMHLSAPSPHFLGVVPLARRGTRSCSR
jgi:hypothetical protein